MSINDTDLDDLDPTEDDLLDLPDALDVEVDYELAFEDDEDDYSPRDDRYDGDGIPSWSAWA